MPVGILESDIGKVVTVTVTPTPDWYAVDIDDDAIGAQGETVTYTIEAEDGNYVAYVLDSNGVPEQGIAYMFHVMAPEEGLQSVTTTPSYTVTTAMPILASENGDSIAEIYVAIPEGDHGEISCTLTPTAGAQIADGNGTPVGGLGEAVTLSMSYNHGEYKLSDCAVSVPEWGFFLIEVKV